MLERTDTTSSLDLGYNPIDHNKPPTLLVPIKKSLVCRTQNLHTLAHIKIKLEDLTHSVYM